jgi:hypothetical protein
MVQFRAMAPGVEVIGEGVLAMVNWTDVFRSTNLEILKKHGISNPRPGEWYPFQDFLDAYREIAETIGSRTLFVIGQKLPENAIFPPEINNFETAMASIDVAYHMNHRMNGVPMFDSATGKMLEGIGHYHFKKLAKETRRVVMICENPYACEFDRGIIDGMATRFKPSGTSFVEVAHDDGQPCRKKGADACTYNISW